MEIVQDPTPWPPSLWIMISVDFESPILQRPLQKCLSQRSWVKMFHFWAEILTRMLLPGNQPSASKSACLLFFKTFLIRKMSQKISGVVGWRETGSFEWQSREGGWWWWGCARVFDELVMPSMSLGSVRFSGDAAVRGLEMFCLTEVSDRRSANYTGRVRCSFFPFDKLTFSSCNYACHI